MAIVKKANRQLTVEEHKIDDYIARGYDQIDTTGELLRKGDPVTLNDYKREYAILKKKSEASTSLLEEALVKVSTLENDLAGKIAEIEVLNARINELESAQEASSAATSTKASKSSTK